jgi:hypothetical protein
MAEPGAPDRDQFLQLIADRLPFDQVEKLDILRDLAGHLADSTARLETLGLSGAAAERAAIERLGPPERLADELTEARHSPRRLLAAAGVGTWAAAGGVIYGYLFTALVLTAVSIAAFIAGSYLHWFGPSTGYGLDATTTTLVALGVGAYAAARKLTSTIAARAGYRVPVARRATAILGGGLVLLYALVGWTGALNWPEVGMLLSLPVWFVVGAWRASDVWFPSRQWRLGVIGLAFVVALAALGIGFDQQGNTTGSGGFQPIGVEKIGLPTPDAIVAATRAKDSAGRRWDRPRPGWWSRTRPFWPVGPTCGLRRGRASGSVGWTRGLPASLTRQRTHRSPSGQPNSAPGRNQSARKRSTDRCPRAGLNSTARSRSIGVPA